LKGNLTKLLGDQSFNQRQFSFGIATAALLTDTSVPLLGQTLPSAEDKKAADASKRIPIQDSSPFVEPVVFTQRELKLQVQPFALHDVLLDEGPLLDGRAWNRASMLGIPAARLLYNFRENKGTAVQEAPIEVPQLMAK
jgi:hypothetical protein